MAILKEERNRADDAPVDAVQSPEGSVLDEKVRHLDSKVFQLRERFRQEKATIKDMRAELEEIDSELIELKPANGRIPNKNKTTGHDELAIAWGLRKLSKESFVCIFCFHRGYRYMGKFPLWFDRPHVKAAEYCVPASFDDPSLYMTEEMQELCCSQGILTFSQGFLMAVSQHAYTLMPAFEYKPVAERENSWTRRAPVEWLGQTREVFFRHDENFPWKYAGTYRCLEVEDLVASQARGLKDSLKLQIVQDTIKTVSEASPLLKELITDLYNNGLARVACVGLQCVGYNRKLLAALLALYEPTWRKRRGADLPDREGRKRIKAEGS